MNQAFIQPAPTLGDKFLSPVLLYLTGKPYFFSADGEISIITNKILHGMKENTPLLVCHAPYTKQRTGINFDNALDILELFAFVHPTKFCVPTPVGILKSLGQAVPEAPDDILLSLLESVNYLLSDLTAQSKDQKRILDLAHAMGLQGRGWQWTPIIFKAFGQNYDYTLPPEMRPTYNVWNHLPEWSEHPRYELGTQHPLTGEETRTRLQGILEKSNDKEQRSNQVNYTTRLSNNFKAKEAEHEPHITLAEAGTGVGKTLGYLTPAVVWTEKNQSPVWISTFTKNLQQQIDSELTKIYPDPRVKESKVTIRKGRENYLCLLNFEEQALSSHLMQNPKAAIASGIIARWISQTSDGDLSGADFSGWLTHLLGAQYTNGLADKRGECIYAACDHYQKCFAERVIRKAQSTPLVIANHATVMIQTATANHNDNTPNRYIFDEGHHLFHAADDVFCIHITGQNAHELRRWILGPEAGRKTRARGLKKRIESILPEHTAIQDYLYRILNAALILPPEHWLKNLNNTGHKTNFEKFTIALKTQIMTRIQNTPSAYSLETSLFPLSDEVQNLIEPVIQDLKNLLNPLKKMALHLEKILTEDMDKYNADQRKRIDILLQSLIKKSQYQIEPWINTLQSLIQNTTDPDFIDWIEIEKIDGKIFDIGLYRHSLNPMKNFAQALKPHLHSAIITSATLRDKTATDDNINSWQSAIELTGTNFLTEQPEHFSIPSPFSYKEQTKILIVNDVDNNKIEELSSAYKHLFKASQGGALGLFTSISRLKSVYEKIETEMANDDLTLYSQHIDGVDTGTLIDMFRDDIHSCLLGTDAVRDGVDIPGESLRLIVFDRVPWPRPTILHKARREIFGKKQYDEQLTRLKLKQAFGRLIRKSTDRGIFIMLDKAMPSRLFSAFPDTVMIEKIGIQEAIHITKDFLNKEQ